MYGKTIIILANWIAVFSAVAVWAGGAYSDYTLPLETLLGRVEKGDAAAQYYLGMKYQYGSGVTRNMTESAKWYSRSAEQGYSRAQYAMGLYRLLGLEVDKDPAKAAKWFLKAHRNGERGAAYQLGRLYSLGQGVPNDFIQAAKWYHLATAQGDYQAMYELGLLRLKGVGLEQDGEAAARLIAKAAAGGLGKAVHEYGKMNFYGLGTPQNRLKAEKIFKKEFKDLSRQSKFDLPEEHHRLGIMYAQGWGTDRNCRKAVYWLEKAALRGRVEAQYDLGRQYSLDSGFGANREKAFYWYKQAAESGYGPAQYALGEAYAQGWGVEVNKKLAGVWFERSIDGVTRAAESGNDQAQCLLGLMYQKGVIKPGDQSSAVYWFNRAVQLGNMDAAIHLGDIYAAGQKEDRLKAIDLFTEAGRRGYAQADDRLNKLVQSLPAARSDAESGRSEPPMTVKSDPGCIDDQFYVSDVLPGNHPELAIHKAIKGIYIKARSGDPSSLCRAAEWCARGDLTGCNTGDAMLLFWMAANQGSLRAQHAIATHYLQRNVTPQEKALGQEMMSQLWLQVNVEAKNNDINAQRELGLMFLRGARAEKDAAKALKWLLRAAEQGDPESAFQVGVMYSKGKLAARDIGTAIKWLRRGSAAGSSKASLGLCRIYATGDKDGGVGRNFEEAVRWARIAEEQGNFDAAGYSKWLIEYRKAKLKAKVYQSHPNGETKRTRGDSNKAAIDSATSPEALFKKGMSYFKKGTRDKSCYTEAARLFRLAAEKEFAPAQLKLGLLYSCGQGVKQNWSQAAQWYTRAAVQGNTDAQFKLAYLYYQGRGVAQNFTKTYIWIKIMINNGIRSGAWLLKKAAKNMTISEITEAEDKADRWSRKKEAGK